MLDSVLQCTSIYLQSDSLNGLYCGFIIRKLDTYKQMKNICRNGMEQRRVSVFLFLYLKMGKQDTKTLGKRSEQRQKERNLYGTSTSRGYVERTADT